MQAMLQKETLGKSMFNPAASCAEMRSQSRVALPSGAYWIHFDHCKDASKIGLNCDIRKLRAVLLIVMLRVLLRCIWGLYFASPVGVGFHAISLNRFPYRSKNDFL